MQMSEIKRQAILAQRQDEIRRFTDKRRLDMTSKQQSGREGVEGNMSKAARHTFNSRIPSTYAHGLAGQHLVCDATKEKSRKLDELKARRKVKDEKKRVRM